MFLATRIGMITALLCWQACARTERPTGYRLRARAAISANVRSSIPKTLASLRDEQEPDTYNSKK